ncbi:hypothetical protein ACIBO5_30135 [Nonomuraea angiospora]|uniref:hypothetical protein n=1 Tax=Nonomuraea angiospora TaxID=46172 RepID=UPI003799F531
MEWLSEAEECLLLNAREMSPLCALLADWTKSEDESKWDEVRPMFLEMIKNWEHRRIVEVYVGPQWPAHFEGVRVKGEDLLLLLHNPRSWHYDEGAEVVISLLPGPMEYLVSAPPEERHDHA